MAGAAFACTGGLQTGLASCIVWGGGMLWICTPVGQCVCESAYGCAGSLSYAVITIGASGL
jgi:hypothetical protein